MKLLPGLNMTNTGRIFAITALYWIISNTYAITVVESTYWKCTVSDAENRQWPGQADYQVSAINRALENCKRESKVPKTCKAAKEACEMIVNGVTTRPMWRCLALDQAAVPWFSNIYDHGDDAAMAAKAYCQANSTLPETCYVYLFNCRNLNIRNF